MKKRILCTLIYSLLVLTACNSNSDKIKATPNEITPTAIVETQAKETARETIAPTEKPTEPNRIICFRKEI